MTPEEAREKLKTALGTWDVETFKRLHRRFFDCVVLVDADFQKRFPQEHAEYHAEFDKEIDNAVDG